MVRPTPFVGEGLKIKSLFLREFRQRVRMAQNWQHFTNELILQFQQPKLSLYRTRRPEMNSQMKGKCTQNEMKLARK